MEVLLCERPAIARARAWRRTAGQIVHLVIVHLVLVSFFAYKVAMRPATPDEIVDALAFALRYRGRSRAHDADAFMARAAAERLLEQLERAGFVLMRKPPSPDHTAPTAPPDS